MSKRPRLSVTGDEVNGKQPRLSNISNISPSCKESISNLRTSMFHENLRLKSELETALKDHETTKAELAESKNDYDKLHKMTEEYIPKADKDLEEAKLRAEEAVVEQERLKGELTQALENNKKVETKIAHLHKQVIKQNHELQDAKDVNKNLNADKKELQKKIDKLDLQLNAEQVRSVEAKHKAHQKRKKVADLQTCLDEVTGELGNQKKTIQQISGTLIVKENELADSRNLIQSKDDQIADLGTQLNLQIELKNKSIELLRETEENSKTHETVAVNLRAEKTNMENRCASLEQQKSAAAQEKVIWMKRFEEKDANFAKAENQNDELKRRLKNFNKDAENKQAKIAKHIEDRAKELFEEWKKNDEDGKEKNNKNRQPGVLEESFHLPNEKFNTSSNNKATKTTDNTNSKCKALEVADPTWRWVRKHICETLFINSKSNVALFLDEFAKELFGIAEILQPFCELEDKMEEIKSVIDYFYPSDTEKAKSRHFNNLKARLRTKRDNERNIEYENCDESRAVAFSPEGDRFYYSSKIGDKWIRNGVWRPYWDKEFQKSMGFPKPDLTTGNKFFVPWHYAKCPYILVLQRCDRKGRSMDKLIPANGRMINVEPEESKAKPKK